MLDTCKVVKKAKKESHDVLGKHVTKLSTYSKLEYIPIEKKYRKVEIRKIRRKSIETFVSNTKKVYRVNCGCYCQKRRQKKIMWTVLSPTVGAFEFCRDLDKPLPFAPSNSPYRYRPQEFDWIAGSIREAPG